MLPKKSPKNQVARQYTGYRGPEEGGDATRAYSIEHACWAVTKESILWRTSVGKVLPRWPEKTLQRHHKSLNIPPKSWEQIALDRAKWRCLIKKKADDYEAKSTAKQKESATSAKPEPRDHHQSRHSQNWLALFATDSWEPKLASQPSNNTPAHMNTL